ncbi:hypothetical protein, partial [Streptomyces sp. GSL17-113]|uniref:hypothetical protein n=1 Tax=Streptomyces sp. GSL17-113 TaxID=3115365 RepID=UPI002E76A6DE
TDEELLNAVLRDENLIAGGGHTAADVATQSVGRTLTGRQLGPVVADQVRLLRAWSGQKERLSTAQPAPWQKAYFLWAQGDRSRGI